MRDFLELLRTNAYPGRGIAVGKDRVYYFIMGRSENSRNRVFELTEDGIRTKAYDESKMVDPSLIIYHPVRETEKGLIVTNGPYSHERRSDRYDKGLRRFQGGAYDPRVRAGRA